MRDRLTGRRFPSDWKPGPPIGCASGEVEHGVGHVLQRAKVRPPIAGVEGVVRAGDLQGLRFVSDCLGRVPAPVPIVRPAYQQRGRGRRPEVFHQALLSEQGRHPDRREGRLRCPTATEGPDCFAHHDGRSAGRRPRDGRQIRSRSVDCVPQRVVVVHDVRQVPACVPYRPAGIGQRDRGYERLLCTPGARGLICARSRAGSCAVFTASRQPR